jgi:membrane-bound ClpP family serine protease
MRADPRSRVVSYYWPAPLGRFSFLPEVFIFVRWLTVLVALLGAWPRPCAAGQNDTVSPPRPLAIEVRLENEAISPITARFISRAIRMAEAQQAQCVVIVLDAPGGLVDSTRQVVKEILRSDVPVVVYVA